MPPLLGVIAGSILFAIGSILAAMMFSLGKDGSKKHIAIYLMFALIGCIAIISNSMDMGKVSFSKQIAREVLLENSPVTGETTSVTKVKILIDDGKLMG